ncbi:MAG: tetratricopeptide repeat protein [Hyphomicrobiales bacterium]
MIARLYLDPQKLDYSTLFNAEFDKFEQKLKALDDTFLRNILLSDFYVSISKYDLAQDCCREICDLDLSTEQKIEYHISTLYYAVNRSENFLADVAIKDIENTDVSYEKNPGQFFIFKYLKCKHLYGLGAYSDALEELQKTKELTEGEHPFYKIYLSQLEIILLLVKGKYHRAEDLWNEILLLIEDQFPVKNGFINIYHDYIKVIIIKYRFDYEEAKVLLKDLLIRGEQLFGEQSSFVALIYYELGNAATYLSEFKDIEYYAFKSYDLRMILFDEYALEVAESYYLLGLYYNLQGDYSESVHIITQAMENLDSGVKESHPFYNVMGFGKCLSMVELGENFQDIVEDMERYLKGIIKGVGEHTTDLIPYYLLYGEMLMILDEEDVAITYLTKAIDICRSHLHDKHPMYSDCMRAKAAYYKLQQDYKNAESCFLEAIDIVKNSNFKDTMRYSNILENLGEMYIESEQAEKALPLYLECLTIEKDILESDHINFILHYTSLCEIGLRLGDNDILLQYSDELKGQLKKIKVKENPFFGKAYQILSLAFEELGRFGESQVAIEMALLHVSRLMVKNSDMGFSLIGLQIDYLRVLVKQNEIEEGISYLKSVLKREQSITDEFELNLRLSDLLHLRGEYDQSIKVCVDFIDRSRDLGMRRDLFCLVLAKNYLKLDNDKEMKKYLDIAYEDRVDLFGGDSHETTEVLNILIEWAEVFGYSEEKSMFVEKLKKIKENLYN